MSPNPPTNLKENPKKVPKKEKNNQILSTYTEIINLNMTKIFAEEFKSSQGYRHTGLQK